MTTWINTVSRDHVERGVRGRFTQANHGKPNMLRKVARGDWIIFYSPKTVFPDGEPLQAFTAIGQVADDEPYQAEAYLLPASAEADIQPWRRNVDFLACTETPIRPLIDQLNFIEDKARWGYKFRFGVFRIDDHDFEVIRSAMGGYCVCMSNVDTAPAEVACAASPFAGVLHPREVPLGGPRAIRVRRTLPQRERSLIGAWCFVDHYGPHDVRGGKGMDVPPHPHTGLQTVSWLFDGEVEHRDSAGVHAMVRPGELNLMTAGGGICHSEVSTSATTVLHGVQLWVALPDSDRDTGRDFAHHVPQARALPGATLRVFLGELEGDRSPVHTFTPLLGAQIDLDPGARLTLDVDPAFEHGVLLDRGRVEVEATLLDVADLAFHAAGNQQLGIANRGDGPARVVLLGGTPFPEQLVMWWNFVGRSHEDIATYRKLWEEHDDRFGAVDGYRGAVLRLPAPPLPNATLRPRPNPGV